MESQDGVVRGALSDGRGLLVPQYGSTFAWFLGMALEGVPRYFEWELRLFGGRRLREAEADSFPPYELANTSGRLLHGRFFCAKTTEKPARTRSVACGCRSSSHSFLFVARQTPDCMVARSTAYAFPCRSFRLAAGV